VRCNRCDASFRAGELKRVQADCKESIIFVLLLDLKRKNIAALQLEPWFYANRGAIKQGLQRTPQTLL
jgi:hypothetical protein